MAKKAKYTGTEEPVRIKLSGDMAGHVLALSGDDASGHELVARDGRDELKEAGRGR